PGNRAIMRGGKATVLVVGIAVATMCGALAGCGGSLVGHPGTAGQGGDSGNGGRAESGGSPPACPAPSVANLCAPSDPQVCSKTCGPDSLGTKTVTCVNGGYSE